MRRILRWIAVVLTTATFGVGVAHANDIEFKKVSLRPIDQAWVLDADLSLQLSPALEQLVNKGVVLHFVTEFQLTKSRWYWFDAKTVEVQRVSKISYQALTNQYRVTLGSFSLSASNLKQALAAVRTIEDWAVIEASAINVNQNYQAAVRMRLDTNQLAKPFQVNAINSRSWNLQSEWQRFEFSPKQLINGVNP
ncbi:DUF4390 domain-containing protein [Polynucleobacter sp. 30F-ANTBAC]|jgi:Domain of unknown function (DUF4390)|uniref:DUF4390 domain-containing protein n=1 Tax=Polynucleobacter sp. 30F-ANTBAC TaxID=2689095 RepID=UPI001C0D6074|nr:DUF4390 domain-containing protein [Polynucleobacter sp. 30F-ANTBAC]MBU3600033.1 DUF4390 domain-containing protein [Polynucleobacter sp. 30F-ANTBAC]